MMLEQRGREGGAEGREEDGKGGGGGDGRESVMPERWFCCFDNYSTPVNRGVSIFCVCVCVCVCVCTMLRLHL